MDLDCLPVYLANDLDIDGDESCNRAALMGA